MAGGGIDRAYQAATAAIFVAANQETLANFGRLFSLMSTRIESRILLILGVVTALLTIGSNLLTLGELKGTVTAQLKAHEDRLGIHESHISAQSEEIALIKGKLSGISSQMGMIPNKVANAIKAKQTEQED